jgi:SnoaL-like domain
LRPALGLWKDGAMAAAARVMDFAAPEEQVRALWDAYDRGGVEAMRAMVGPDVEWVPWSAGGEVLHGQQALAEWVAARRGQATSAVLHGVESHGRCVLAHGSLRVFREGGFVDMQPSWVYYFRGHRMIRAAGFSSREDALASIAAFNAEG